MIVQRAGDVIPQIVGPAGPHAKGTKAFRMPERCPLCDAEIVKPEGEVDAPLPEPGLPVARARDAEQLGAWPRWTSRASASSSSRRLWDEGLLRSMPDLYRLTTEQLMELDGYARDLGARTRSRRSSGRRRSRSRASSSGSTSRDVGWVTAQNLARHFGDVDRLLDASQEEIQEVDGHRARPRRGDRRVVRRRAEPRARRRAARARAPLRGRRGGAAEGGAADRHAVRDHRARSSAARARRRRRRSRRSAPRSPTTSRRRRRASSSARARARRWRRREKAGVPILSEADLRELRQGRAG